MSNNFNLKYLFKTLSTSQMKF